ncbi:MAG: Clp protease N-terminal domain-containing protein [Rhodomicrobium sp.]
MTGRSEGYLALPYSSYLHTTVRRARALSERRSHRYVTLEHLLLALVDDPDARGLLKAVGADAATIQGRVSDIVNNKMVSLAVPDGRPPAFSYKFESLMLSASQVAAQIGRQELDAAVVLTVLAKGNEGDAAAILASAGFDPAIAYRTIAEARQHAPRPAQPAASSASPPAQQTASTTSPNTASAGGHIPASPSAYQAEMQRSSRNPPAEKSGDSFIDEVLASVRSILDDEDRKEQGFVPNGAHAPSMPPPLPPMQPRLEPRFGTNGGLEGRPPGRAQAGVRPPAPSQRWDQPQPVHRQQPSLGPAAGPNFPASRAGAPQGYGFHERAVPPLVNDAKPHPQREPRKRRRAQETPSQLLQAIEHVPRKARMAVPETIEIRLSKEDIAAIFSQVSYQGQGTQGGKFPATYRAVTIRLSAPEGGFLVEPIAPETQWVFDRPSFLGEEAFGTWTWTVVPNERGSHFLVVSMSARDLDENGLAGDISLPDQAIQIRVRGSFWRGLWRLISTALLLLAGSGITVGAFYALKLLGKLPPMFLK